MKFRYCLLLCRWRSLGLGILFFSFSGCAWIDQANPLGDRRFTAQNLGVIVNEKDPLSVQVGQYYQQKRGIPAKNIIRVSFAPVKNQISAEKFQQIQAQVNQQLSSNIQGLALTWTTPFRVNCMSITSAFALGYDPVYCAKGCSPTAPNAYFQKISSRPYRDFQVRPTMMIAGQNFAAAKQLIDRGVDADGSFPQGTAYLLSTKDKARNVRSVTFGQTKAEFGSKFNIEIIEGNVLADRRDVMFYFTGLPRVEQLQTLTFRPGAIADHLTSFGGVLNGKGQMSSLRWLEAGATGSYGTVEEPCNFPQKFPHVPSLMKAYLRGATLLESYWQSVFWPGQGIFIGEPLARPFGKS